MFKKFIKINNYYLQIRCIYTKPCLLSTSYKHNKNELTKTPLSKELLEIYEEHKQNILYSSFMENNVIKLSYQKNKLFENIIEKQTKQNILNNISVKPFPTTLKYMLDETVELEKSLNSINDEQHSNISLENEQLKLLGMLKNSRYNDDKKEESHTQNWMQDYELFDESENVKSKYGTPDPSVPVSKIQCYGCGAYLHCVDSGLPGYLPSELFTGKSDHMLRSVTCQRCHFLKNYNTAINLTVSSDEYVKMIASISDKFALAILMVDLIDFPCSIWPGIKDILGKQRPVFVVGNKVDLLPKDSRGYLNHIKNCLTQAITDAGISEVNIKHTCLISAETGYGVEELITKLQSLWRYKGDVYLVGCTNVGKSTLFNALLRSDYCKVEASNIIQKATASQWPGTTLRLLKFPILRPSDMRLYLRQKRISSERSQKYAEAELRRNQARKTGRIKYATLIGHIGQSFESVHGETQDPFHLGKKLNEILHIDENSDRYKYSKWCYDTPGVFQPEQILNLLTTEELLLTIPKQMIKPRAYAIEIGMSIFLAGLGRLDYIGPNEEKIRILVYSSLALPILITYTKDADTIYKTFLGTELLGVPMGDENRLTNWPNLECSDVICVKGESEDISVCDILLSSAGWVGINLPENSIGNFKIWTPFKRGIVVRKPSLIPYGIKLKGSKIRNSLAYNIGKAFIK